MPQPKRLIVITNRELSDGNLPALEKDCACPDDNFLLINTKADSQPSLTPVPETVSDCACPTDAFALTQLDTPQTDHESYSLPALHLDACIGDFHLAFNPLGQAGVVVFNDPVLKLLDVFRKPRTLADGLRAAGNPPGGLE